MNNEKVWSEKKTYIRALLQSKSVIFLLKIENGKKGGK